MKHRSVFHVVRDGVGVSEEYNLINDVYKMLGRGICTSDWYAARKGLSMMQIMNKMHNTGFLHEAR